MSWRVYGFMEPGGYSRDAHGEVYGPLPRKRWIPDGKRYKLKHRVSHWPTRAAAVREIEVMNSAVLLKQVG